MPARPARAEHRGMSTKKSRWDDGAIYALSLAGVYLLVGVLFFYGGKSKIIDGHGMPDGLKKQFSGTFLNTIPGLDAAWTILGILESLIFILLVISLLRLEFKPSRDKTWLLRGLALAIFTFSILAVGQNVVGETSGVAQLFLYAGATGVLIGLVLHLPPYRGEI
jgi:hypothetical protein